MHLKKSSELYDMAALPDDRLRLFYHGTRITLENGEGNEKTKFINERCRREIEHRVHDATHYET